MQPHRSEDKNIHEFHLNNCSGNFLWKEDTPKSPWKNKVIALQNDFLLLHCFPFASAVCLLWAVQLWFFGVSSSKSTAELVCTEENCYFFFFFFFSLMRWKTPSCALYRLGLWHEWNLKITISLGCSNQGYTFVLSFRWGCWRKWVVA